MKIIVVGMLLIWGIFYTNSFAQSPEGRSFGFGLVVGDPTGLTLKFWSQRNNAIVVDVGASYFGSPRIGVDYLWHFDAFRSNTAKLYAGIGGALGIGQGKGFYYTKHDGFYYRTDNSLGIAARGVLGVNFIPRATPLELFLELGLLVGISPESGSALDAALGIRFYP